MYASANVIDASAIPVIDVAGLEADGSEAFVRDAREMRAAAEGLGFFYIRNHGVPRALIAELFEVSAAFFARPLDHKLKVRVNERHRGFLRIGEAKMVHAAEVDLKESFVWGLDVAADDADFLAGNPMIGPNTWPDDMPEMRATLCAFYDACNACGQRLLKAFAVGLGVDADYFVRRFTKPVSRGSIIYYPPQSPDLGEAQFGVAPHTDYGALTLLAQDDTGGLQVLARDGGWLTAAPVEDSFVVNVGDLLARWTNDRFASTAHRVVNSSGRKRYSAAVFVDPEFDTLIEPVVLAGERPHYDPIRCGEHIQARYDAAFSYRQV